MRGQIVRAVVSVVLVATACAGGSATSEPVGSSPEANSTNTSPGLEVVQTTTSSGEVPVVIESFGDLAADVGDQVSAVGESPLTKLYVISTVDDVELVVPIQLELPVPAAGLQAVLLVDGVVEPVPVLGDTTATVEITH